MLNFASAGTSRDMRQSGSNSEDEDPQQQIYKQKSKSADNLVRTLRHMEINTSKPCNLQREKFFEMWIERTKFYLKVNKCQDADKTSSLLLVDVDLFDALLE